MWRVRQPGQTGAVNLVRYYLIFTVVVFTFCIFQQFKVFAGQESDLSDAQLNDVFWGELYKDGGETLYCGISFGRGKLLSLLDEALTKEHVVPLNWMAKSFGCTSSAVCEISDYKIAAVDMHNLWPAIRRINSSRGEQSFGEIQGEQARKFTEICADYERETGSEAVVEPRDEVKGEIARSVLYMLDQYELNWDYQSREIINEWDKIDPPSDEEKRRNDVIAWLQGNRNAYIDNYRTRYPSHAIDTGQQLVDQEVSTVVRNGKSTLDKKLEQPSISDKKAPESSQEAPGSDSAKGEPTDLAAALLNPKVLQDGITLLVGIIVLGGLFDTKRIKVARNRLNSLRDQAENSADQHGNGIVLAIAYFVIRNEKVREKLEELDQSHPYRAANISYSIHSSMITAVALTHIQLGTQSADWFVGRFFDTSLATYGVAGTKFVLAMLAIFVVIGSVFGQFSRWWTQEERKGKTLEKLQDLFLPSIESEDGRKFLSTTYYHKKLRYLLYYFQRGKTSFERALIAPLLVLGSVAIDVYFNRFFSLPFTH